MNLILERRVFTDKSTIGELTHDKFRVCDILERPWENGANRRNTLGSGGNNSTAILPGKYAVIRKYSPLNKMDVPVLIGTPGRSEIEIHPGNYPHDSLGCLLPGTYNHYVPDMVAGSRNAFAELSCLIFDALEAGEQVWLTIQNPQKLSV